MPRPANYTDPPPGQMGWEWDQLQTRQKLIVEKTAFEDSPAACLIGDATPAGAISPAIEKIIRAKFQFDAGWSFHVTDKLVYSIYLMIRQLVGNCVAASHCLLLATRISHEIVGMGQLEEPLGAGMLGVPFIPFSYGVGRDAAGIRGKGDGSTCQGQIEGTREHGFLPCYIAELKQFKGTGDADFPQGTAVANRSFGSSIANCKPWFEYAKKFELTETPLIESADDAYECIAEKKIPIQICSDVGFKHTADKKYGDLYVPGPSWSHSMQIVGALTFKGERFIVVRNQWGDEAHTGNELMGIPGGSMVLAFDVADRYIKRSHAVGIGEIVGLATTLEF